MILVPRQLRRAGMTGSVPYYGGRFTPEQAYAAAHPQSTPLGRVTPRFGGQPPHQPGAATAAPVAPMAPVDPAEMLRSLEKLRDSGVITAAEFDELRTRMP